MHALLLLLLLLAGGLLQAAKQDGAADALLARAQALTLARDHLGAAAALSAGAEALAARGPSQALAAALEALADSQGTLRQHAAAAESRARALSARLQAAGGSLPAAELVMAYALAAKDLKGARAYGAALGALGRARAAGERAGGLGPAVEASLLSMESELRDCTGEAGAALAALEQAAALRGGAPPSPEEQLNHLDLLRKALAAEDPPAPRGVAAALARRAAALEAALLARGPWQHAQQLPRTFTPGLRSAPWHEHSGAGARWPALTAPAAAALAAAAPALRAEFGELARAGLLLEETECVHTGGYNSSSGSGSGSGGAWRWAATNGFWQPRDAAGCATSMPAACALLAELARALPRLRVLRAGYSAISGHAHLRPHCGWSNQQLKMHLGLRVPRAGDGSGPCATLRVGNETRAWARDAVLMFDDSWEHEVVHRCAAQRVVFQLVFEHPDLQEQQGRAQGARRQAPEEQV